jgi:hypothetical protein
VGRVNITAMHLELLLGNNRPPALTDLEFIKPAILYGDRIKLFSPNERLMNLFGQELSSWRMVPAEIKLDVANSMVMELEEQLPEEFRRWWSRNRDRYSHYLQEGRLSAEEAAHLRVFDSLFETVFDSMANYYLEGTPAFGPILRLRGKGLLELYPVYYADDLTSAPEIEFIGDTGMTPEAEAIGQAVVKRMLTVLESPDTYPLFDRRVSDWMAELPSDSSATRNRGSGHHREVSLAGELFGQLPGFPRATVDELVDIREELDGPLRRFRVALAGISEELNETRTTDEFRAEARHLWTIEVSPALQEIEDATRSNTYLYQLTEHLLAKPDGLVAAGGLLVGGMAGPDVPQLVTSAAATALPAARALWEHQKGSLEIRRNKFYFLYALQDRLK